MRIERPRPVAEQVNSIIRQRIQDRKYPPGSRLPSESALAKELGVSRATVRTALARLASDGLVLRKQGDGTYVNERIRDINTHYGGLWDFSRLIEANGYQPAIRTLAIEQREATVQEAAALALTPGAIVLSMVRLFLADERPAILATNVIASTLIQTDTESFDSDLPIHQFLQNYCHATIAYAVSDIEATMTEGELNRVLLRDSSAPVLKLIETFYDKNNQPLVFGLSYYDHMVLRLRLVQAWG